MRLLCTPGPHQYAGSVTSGLCPHSTRKRHDRTHCRLPSCAANALIPLVTVIGLSLGLLVTGSFFIESIFNIPGIAQITLNSIYQRDYPVIQATTVLIAIGVVVGN